METKKLRAKTEKELNELLKKTQGEIEKNVKELMQGKTKDTTGAKKSRRLVARIKTVLMEKKVLAEITAESKDA